MRYFFLAIVFATLAFANMAAADEYREFQTRPGVAVPAVIVAGEEPKAVVVLFAGGTGTIGVRDDGTIIWGSNFPVASRAKFAQKGMLAVVVDAPTDQTAGGREMNDSFRESAEHAEDVRMVIAALRKAYGLPVWLVGTSRGTTSVANAGIRLQNGGPDGIVLTASVSVDHQRGGNLLRMDLGSIRVPVLVAHHINDDCKVTPYEGARKIRDSLTGAPIADLISFDGGKERGNPCSPSSHHGFQGQRGKVVKAISNWIASH